MISKNIAYGGTLALVLVALAGYVLFNISTSTSEGSLQGEDAFSEEVSSGTVAENAATSGGTILSDNESIVADIEKGFANQEALHAFEDEIFSYINKELDKILQEDDADLSGEEIYKVLQEIGRTATDRINTFRSSQDLSDEQRARIDEIELYVHMQVTKDRQRSEDLIVMMANGYSKVAVLMSYLGNFSSTEDHATLEDFALIRNAWASEFMTGDYAAQVKLTLFKAHPIGQLMPNHFKNARDINGKSLSLDSFVGKTVLIDFWATWCLPCIEELPYHKEAYYQYHDSGFEIIYINLGEDKRAFFDFIEKEKLVWHHLFDGAGFGGEVARRYGIERLPTSFLLDGTGKIIRADIKGNDLRVALSSLLSS